MFVGCVSIFTIARGLIFIPHANTILADYGKALILSKETYSNKQKTPPSKPRSSRIKTCLENAETSDRHQTVPDPHLPCTIIISNQAFLSSTDPLTRAEKRCQHMPPSFGVKYPFAPKLFPNYNYFLQAVALKALHAIATINPASRLLRWGHLINTSGYPPLPLLCNLSHSGHFLLH